MVGRTPSGCRGTWAHNHTATPCSNPTHLLPLLLPRVPPTMLRATYPSASCVHLFPIGAEINKPLHASMVSTALSPSYTACLSPHRALLLAHHPTVLALPQDSASPTLCRMSHHSSSHPHIIGSHGHKHSPNTCTHTHSLRPTHAHTRTYLTVPPPLPHLRSSTRNRGASAMASSVRAHEGGSPPPSTSAPPDPVGAAMAACAAWCRACTPPTISAATWGGGARRPAVWGESETRHTTASHQCEGCPPWHSPHTHTTPHGHRHAS